MNQPVSVKIGIPITGYEAVTITDEEVSVPAGAIGSLVDFYILKKPIADANSSFVGGNGNSSISFTSDIFDTEVAFKSDAELANGEYWIDYITGHGRGRKADTGTTLTVTYKVFQKL